MNIKEILVDLVDEGERLRAINPVYVADIALSYELKGGEGRGQITPIEVREEDSAGKYRLISGAHRLAAAKTSGWKTIAASIVKCTNDEARLREIDENLVRHELTALDRSAFMAEREQVWKALHPDTVQGRAGAMARWHAKDSLSFASDASEKLGISRKTIDRWIALSKVTRWLSGDDRNRLAVSNIANNQSELRALSDIKDPAQRLKVLELLLSGEEGAPRKVVSALKRLAGETAEASRRSKDDKDYDAFMGVWARCSETTKGHIASFVEAYKPKRRRAKAAMP